MKAETRVEHVIVGIVEGAAHESGRPAAQADDLETAFKVDDRVSKDCGAKTVHEAFVVAIWLKGRHRRSLAR